MTTPTTNLTEFTVSELSFALKRTVEDSFSLVRVRGEISGFKGAVGSGHCYFRLKDERACLEAVVWKTTLSRLRFKPQEGLEMVATGKLTTYPGRSNYQIVVDNLEPAGAGALMALLDERRRKLQAEGLFETARKRPLPYLPATIGVVTSPTGAVIRDILHRLRDRFPRHVLLWPVRVQGEGAAEEIAAAIAGFNVLPPGGPIPRPDLLIVARGGGSIEDLWAFNEEVAVRAVAASGIPVIAAVGHETDWTLVDHAADRRAPTPTGAAEMAVPVLAELQAAVSALGARHRAAARRHLDAEHRHYVTLCRALPSPGSLLAIPQQRVDELGRRLRRASPAAGRFRANLDELARRLRRGLPAEVEVKRREFAAVAARLSPAAVLRATDLRRSRLDAADARLHSTMRTLLRNGRNDFTRLSDRVGPASVRRAQAGARDGLAVVIARFAALEASASPQAILAKGYAVVRNAHGRVVSSPGDVAAGDRLHIRFVDGGTTATVSEAAPAEVRRRSTPPARHRQPAPSQESLF